MKYLGHMLVALFFLLMVGLMLLQHDQNVRCEDAGGIPTIDGCLNPTAFVEIYK